MASLKKPAKCPKCLESESLQKIVVNWTAPHYEGWFCNYCVLDTSTAIWPKAFIVYRPKRSKDCRVCGAKREEVPFCKRKNLCKKCQSKIHAEYRVEKEPQLRQWRKDYWAKQDPKARWQKVREVIQGSVDAFLRDQMYHIKSHARKPSKRDVKDLERRKFDLDGPFLLELWNKQGGRCAITGLEMSHQFGNLQAVSIDRIDSSIGHVKGNVQLVCQCVNLMKNEHSNLDVEFFLSMYFHERLRRLCVETGQGFVTAVQNCASHPPLRENFVRFPSLVQPLPLVRPDSVEVGRKLLAVEELPQGGVVGYDAPV